MKPAWKTIPLFALIAVSLFASACGGSDSTPKTPPPPPAKKGTVFDGMVGAKEKARLDTEKAMEVNKQKLEEAMKKSEEPATP